MKYFIFRVCLSFFCLSFCFFLTAQTVEKILATVEGEMISLLDLKETRKTLTRKKIKNSVLLSLFKKSQLQKKDSELLKFLIYKKLLDISVAQNKNIQKQFSANLKLKQAVKKGKLSKKSVLRNIFIQFIIAEKIKLSDQDLNEYALQTQGKALFTSFKYELAYLFFPRSKKGKLQAQKTIQILLKDPSYFNKWKPSQKSEKRGFLKNLSLSTLHPSIKTKIKKLPTGQISSLLLLSTGYHIFKILWKTPIITKLNEKRKQKLAVSLFNKKLKKQLKIWLQNQQKISFIKINL